MIHFGAIQIKVGRILRMHAALIEGIGGPSRTEAEHHQPRFNHLNAPINCIHCQRQQSSAEHPQH